MNDPETMPRRPYTQEMYEADRRYRDRERQQLIDELESAISDLELIDRERAAESPYWKGYGHAIGVLKLELDRRIR